MALFLPHPQEIRYRPESLTWTNRLRLYIAPRPDEDAVLECLQPALDRHADGRASVQELSLPGADGCSLAFAADAATATTLAAMAWAQLDTPVDTLNLCLDGGNMREPMDGMGKPTPPPEGLRSTPEAYSLCIRPEGVAIAGSNRAGLFYGVQTLLQAIGCGEPTSPCLDIRDFPSQRVRGVHFDMKYTFFRFETILAHLHAMAAMKLNVALFEYEDKFPYRRHPVIVDRARALTTDQIAELRQTAARLHIRIVPLVQTLGHLEFALHHPSMAHLREVPDGYTMICPRNPEAVQFVKDMIEEVLEAHPDAPMLHIGGDETALLGRCPSCKPVATERGPVAVWVDHYAELCRFVVNKGIRPILWDDIVRRDATQAERLPRETILGYWIYETVRERHGERAIPDSLQAHYDSAGRRAAELPDTLSFYPHYDTYRQLGFDVIAVPCFNVGTLVPNFEITTRNTATWAEKTNLCGGMGMINSWWASFMMHPDACWYGIAQTADNTWWWPSINRLDLDTRFGETFFGLATPEIAECLAALSVGVGFPSRLKRPLSLLSHAFMENVIHFEGNMEMRQKYGQAVTFKTGADAADVVGGAMDVHNHLLRKLELIEEDGLGNEIRRQLDYAEGLMDSAVRRLATAKPRVDRHADVVDLLLMQAEMKAMRCRHWRFFLDVFARRDAAYDAETLSRAEALLLAERSMRRRFADLFAAKLCEPDAALITGRMFDGEKQFLEECAAGKAIAPSRRTAFATMADQAEDVRDV